MPRQGCQFISVTRWPDTREASSTGKSRSVRCGIDLSIAWKRLATETGASTFLGAKALDIEFQKMSATVSVGDLLPRVVVDPIDRDDCLGATIDTELLQNCRYVRLDCRLGHAKLIGDLLVEQTLSQHHQHAYLLWRQGGQPGNQVSGFFIARSG